MPQDSLPEEQGRAMEGGFGAAHHKLPFLSCSEETTAGSVLLRQKVVKASAWMVCGYGQDHHGTMMGEFSYMEEMLPNSLE